MDYVNSQIKKPKRPNTELLELWLERELDIENPGSYGNLPTDQSHVDIEALSNGNYKMKISDVCFTMIKRHVQPEPHSRTKLGNEDVLRCWLEIKIEEKYHPKTLGGHIFHAFMGESYSDPDSLMSLTDKIARNSDIGFWAYSSALSFCVRCKTLMKGLQDNCAACGETKEVEWYDRITGYVQQVGRSRSASGGWNPGKMQELLDRKRF